MSNIEKKLARYVNGELSNKETEDLLIDCKDNPDLLKKISELTETERLLSAVHFQEELNCQETLQNLRGNTPDFTKDILSKIENRNPKKRLTLIFYSLASAAALILAFTIYGSFQNIATQTSSLDARWQNSTQEEFPSGDYTLLEGYSQLEFKNGAKLIIEAPAEFTIINSMHVYLKSGKVVADIPKPAIGFRIDTKTSQTIDLGTTFAVATNKNGSSEIHVIKGLVKSKSVKTKTFKELKTNEALSINNKLKESKLEADSGKFLTLLPPKKLKDFKYILWRFNEGKGQTSNYDSHGYKSNQSFTAQLRSENETYPKWIDGKFGKALQFNGTSNYAETGFKGIGGSQARTVSFWLKTNKNYTDKNGYAIVSWGSFNNSGSTWQISLNPTSSEGPLGRIRCGTHRGQIIGTTDLRDNKWHHISVVLYGGSDVNVSTHILIYVDGKLEQASRKSIRKIYTDVESDEAIKVQFARNAADTMNPKKPKQRFFNGALDEIYVFNSALSQKDILNLMSNKPVHNK
ncbi:MAG: FecR domain-containing protein [Lentisphaeraceae bacterium]|nr:FecR domain-containing protein [Lentisphaeraceae bacterium]